MLLHHFVTVLFLFPFLHQDKIQMQQWPIQDLGFFWLMGVTYFHPWLEAWISLHVVGLSKENISNKVKGAKFMERETLAKLVLMDCFPSWIGVGGTQMRLSHSMHVEFTIKWLCSDLYPNIDVLSIFIKIIARIKLKNPLKASFACSFTSVLSFAFSFPKADTYSWRSIMRVEPLRSKVLDYKRHCNRDRPLIIFRIGEDPDPSSFWMQIG